MAKFASITIMIEDDGKFNLPKFGEEIFGGKVTALAAYSCYEALEISRDALEDISYGEGADAEIARAAVRQVNNHINLSLSGEA